MWKRKTSDRKNSKHPIMAKVKTGQHWVPLACKEKRIDPRDEEGNKADEGSEGEKDEQS